VSLATATLASPRSARKAKGDGHLRRAEILEAAERIFIAEGYEGATIRKIADEVGVSSTALYIHFPDKGAILLEICEAALRKLLATNSAIAALKIDPKERMRLLLDDYMRWGLTHPNAYQLVYSAPRPTGAESWSPGTAELTAQCYAAYKVIMTELQAAGRLRAGSIDSAGQSLWMACHGVVALLTARQAFPWAPQEELMALTLNGLLDGLVTD
jgi:AcrR family transcriptional regulator